MLFVSGHPYVASIVLGGKWAKCRQTVNVKKRSVMSDTTHSMRVKTHVFEVLSRLVGNGNDKLTSVSVCVCVCVDTRTKCKQVELHEWGDRTAVVDIFSIICVCACMQRKAQQ